VTTARRGRAALGVALAMVALIASSCSARHTGPTATPAPGPPAGSPAPAPSPAPLADAVRQWETSAGEHFTQSGLALQQVSEASAADDEAALQSGCYKLHDANTVGLQHDLPTPDRRLTDELQRMIDDINTATHACVRFVLARDDVDAATYQDYLARAVGHLHRAKGFLNEDLAPK